MHNTYGMHVVAELTGCKEHLIGNVEYLLVSCEDACRIAGMDIVRSYAQKFYHSKDKESYGVSVFLILQESHLSLHSWPESEYVAIDIYICGHKNKYKPEKALEYLVEKLYASKIHVSELERGLYDGEQFIHRIIGWEEEIMR